jgi:hypothetical protein
LFSQHTLTTLTGVREERAVVCKLSFVLATHNIHTLTIRTGVREERAVVCKLSFVLSTHNTHTH